MSLVYHECISAKLKVNIGSKYDLCLAKLLASCLDNFIQETFRSLPLMPMLFCLVLEMHAEWFYWVQGLAFPHHVTIMSAN